MRRLPELDVPCLNSIPPAVGPAVRAQGAVLLPGIFARDLMDRLREEMDNARRREESRLGLEFLRSIGQEGYVSDVLGIGPSIVELLDDDALHALLDEVFGEEVRLWVAQGIQLDPGKGRASWPRCWHADMFKQAHELCDPAFTFAVNFLVLIDDVTANNGATVALPGSHRLPELYRTDEDYLTARVLEAAAPSGSVFLIEGGAWHAAGLNRTTSPRRLLKLLFTRRWIIPQIDYLFMAGPALTAQLPARVKRLFDVNA
jgi:hypothetical protein